MATTSPSARSYAFLSIGAAVVTIALKFFAYVLTNSVGLLSDAIESIVNLVAAVVALWALTRAAQPADQKHPFGHSKAEYFSSGLEGALIIIAAVSIASHIYRIVPQIPKGQVATSGQVVKLANLYGKARLLGYALYRVDMDASDIPWHRVINAKGEISHSPLRHGTE